MSITGAGFLPSLKVAPSDHDHDVNASSSSALLYALCHFGATAVQATVISDSSLSCVSPPNPSGPVAISITIDGIHAIVVNNGNSSFFPFVVVAAEKPMVRPIRGSTKGATIIAVSRLLISKNDIVECNFGPYVQPSRNIFWEVSTPSTILSATEISCMSPESASAGRVKVGLIINGIKTLTGTQFTYQVPSSIVAVVPSLGSTAGGTAVIVYGVSFYTHGSMPGVCQCIFGNTSVPGLIVSSTAIECKSPASPFQSSGAVTLGISLDGQDISPSISFRYISPVTIVSIYPKLGLARGGSTVRVYGSGRTSHVACL